MKTLKPKLTEDQTLYIAPNFHKTFMIPRAEMPQIESKHIGDFLLQNNVPNVIQYADTNTLYPTQSQFNPEKITNMSESAKMKPILVSADNYVLDGHHRWLANHYSKRKQAVIKLPWDAAQSLSVMNSYSNTFSKSISEDGAAAVSIGGGAISQEPVVKNKPKVLKRQTLTFKEWTDANNNPATV